jgi:hypothetical protein
MEIQENSVSTEVDDSFIMTQILTDINQLSQNILTEHSKTNILNENSIFELTEVLKDLTSSAAILFPQMFALSSGSFFGSLPALANHGSIQRELLLKNTLEKGTQMEGWDHFHTFDRSVSVGRIICQAMKHFREDTTNFTSCSVSDDYPIPLILPENKYFIGFCNHTQNGESVISTPKYGMLFSKISETMQGDNLYLGKVDTEGVPSSNMGLFFQDLNFSDDCLTQHEPHKITFNTDNRVKSYYKGGMENGKFHGKGELLNIQPETLIINLPLLISQDLNLMNFKKLRVKPGSDFAQGQLMGNCEIELTNDPSKPKEYPITSYKGGVKDGAFSGKGRLTNTNGDVYDGHFLNGLKSGQGTYTSFERIYEGEWLEDFLNGDAKVRYKNEGQGEV